jgi:hypothetical protein
MFMMLNLTRTETDGSEIDESIHLGTPRHLQNYCLLVTTPHNIRVNFIKVTAKLSLYSTKHWAVECGGVQVQLRTFLTSALD